MALGRRHMTAAGLGLEPRYSPPEGDVLPLDDPAISENIAQNKDPCIFYNT